MKLKHALSGIALAVGVLTSAQAVNNIQVYFTFTPAGEAKLSLLGKSRSSYAAEVVAAFNQASLNSGGGPYFSISQAGSSGQIDYGVPPILEAVLPSLEMRPETVFAHDWNSSDLQMVVDANPGFVTPPPSMSGGLGDTGSHPENGFIYVNLMTTDAHMTVVQLGLHELGHSLGASHQISSLNPTARAYAIKLPLPASGVQSADETNCRVYQTLMQSPDDADMIGPGGFYGWTTQNAYPGAPAPGWVNWGVAQYGDTLVHACQAFVAALPGAFPYWSAFNGDKYTLNYATYLEVTTPNGIGQNECHYNVSTTTEDGAFPTHHFTTNVGVGSASGGIVNNRPFVCPQVTRADVYSNQLITYNAGGLGTFYAFGDSTHNAVQNQMITRSGFVKNYHNTKLIPTWIGRIWTILSGGG